MLRIKKRLILIMFILIIPIVNSSLGDELVTNTGFYITESPWVIEGFEWTHNFDVMEYTDYGADDTFYQTISITEGSDYNISVNINTASSAGGTTIGLYLGGTLAGTLSNGDTGWSSFIGTAGSNGKVEVKANGVDSFSDYWEVNSVSVKEVISDSCVSDGVVSEDCTTDEDESISGLVTINSGAVWGIDNALVTISG